MHLICRIRYVMNIKKIQKRWKNTLFLTYLISKRLMLAGYNIFKMWFWTVSCSAFVPHLSSGILIKFCTVPPEVLWLCLRPQRPFPVFFWAQCLWRNMFPPASVRAHRVLAAFVLVAVVVVAEDNRSVCWLLPPSLHSLCSSHGHLCFLWLQMAIKMSLVLFLWNSVFSLIFHCRDCP